MSISKDQKSALDDLDAGRSVFLTGEAGSGKTWLVNEFIRRNPNRSIARLATTGAAAQLIGGQTAHSFFRLNAGIYQPGQVSADLRLRAKIRGFRTIIIEEISMARIDLFQAVRDMLYSAARGYGDFAGYQLICVGDFAQLPPVCTPNERSMLEALYGEGALFSFQSRHWDSLRTFELTTPHRQADDLGFARWLGDLRAGRAPDLDFINSRVGAPADPAATTYLVATRSQAQRINEERMSALPPGFFHIQGETTGQFGSGMMPVPQKLFLKPDSRVVICANNPSEGYINGSTGRLVKCRRDEKGKPVAEVILDSGRAVLVKSKTWDNTQYDLTGGGEVGQKSLGTYTQLPLLPGWAITIHRSQGMSLDHLHIDPRGIFEAGQAYVALSRATSLEALSFSAPFERTHFREDARVRGYMGSALGHARPDAAPQPA